MGCNDRASANLHGVAFFAGDLCGIHPDMAGKYPNYIAAWRRARELSQKELVARLVELGGGNHPDYPALKVPKTEASLSRIENGEQNFGIATLHALADALQVDEPGWLLDRDPTKEGAVLDFVGRLTAKQQEQARAVLEAMFASATG